jgi:serine/threonine-protein kinase RIM15
LLGIGHSYPVDWWSLGAVLYEFLCGLPPFSASTVEEIFQNIQQRNIQWPDDISSAAKDLINKLLVLNPEERLGSSGTDAIKQHPFFHSINWDTLLTQHPPFVPKLEDPESTAYFQRKLQSNGAYFFNSKRSSVSSSSGSVERAG